MIIGKIRPDQEAVIELEVVGLNHREKVEVVIDKWCRNDFTFGVNPKFHKGELMQVNIQNKNFTLLEIQGRVIGQDALVLKTMLEEHIQKIEAQAGTPTLIFDLAGAETMDSAGLGVLITSSTQIRQNGGRTALVNVNRGIRRMLIRTNLTSLFDFPKNLAEAITSSFQS